MFLDVDGRAESKKFGQCVRSLSVEVCKVPAVVEQLTSLYDRSSPYGPIQIGRGGASRGRKGSGRFECAGIDGTWSAMVVAFNGRDRRPCGWRLKRLWLYYNHMGRDETTVRREVIVADIAKVVEEVDGS
ncbi:hypothetical protein Pmar_PMAR025861 [Perkinsus marinus ATCC 50983]|uniref:Uncharacterized protein n=1 Tax=Perkinsus marinus (strain ATCC 50983 / TXsc) TaxID=423536 RepID=C5LUX3_PERM5|nr:hypothetical protein Pmar_PMAR025861 [Perkinsus marinus ATCC 50983]EEQ99473.1 hypothetical protein Pmar_PMAR025861 [Perkinsus marinus ATCC 50983]|eukprot:XP_002766756.1 hypothetical protein Pmar_PMAR025861 [Perkinsus marinus ATCC 50983]